MLLACGAADTDLGQGSRAGIRGILFTELFRLDIQTAGVYELMNSPLEIRTCEKPKGPHANLLLSRQ